MKVPDRVLDEATPQQRTYLSGLLMMCEVDACKEIGNLDNSSAPKRAEPKLTLETGDARLTNIGRHTTDAGEDARGRNRRCAADLVLNLYQHRLR